MVPIGVSVAAVLLLGLSAGLFFAFTVAVMPGLRIVDDRTFVSAMTAINRAILNRWFLLVFIGAAVTVTGAAVIASITGAGGSGWFIASAALYIAGVIGVTGLVSVPLNVALERNSQRSGFEARWVRFNVVRTAAATLALASAVVGVAVGA